MAVWLSQRAPAQVHQALDVSEPQHCKTKQPVLGSPRSLDGGGSDAAFVVSGISTGIKMPKSHG